MRRDLNPHLPARQASVLPIKLHIHFYFIAFDRSLTALVKHLGSPLQARQADMMPTIRTRSKEPPQIRNICLSDIDYYAPVYKNNPTQARKPERMKTRARNPCIVESCRKQLIAKGIQYTYVAHPISKTITNRLTICRGVIVLSPGYILLKVVPRFRSWFFSYLGTSIRSVLPCINQNYHRKRDSRFQR